MKKRVTTQPRGVYRAVGEPQGPGQPFAVRHIITADAGEPEAWALVSPTESRNAHRENHLGSVRLCE
jgi:hypothetical protein